MSETRRIVKDKTDSITDWGDISGHEMGSDEHTKVLDNSVTDTFTGDNTFDLNKQNKAEEKPHGSNVNSDSDVTQIYRVNKKKSDTSDEAKKSSYMDDPVVGWVVVIAGPGKGASLTIGYGMNTIGRGDARISLNFGDTEITRDNHASLSYDPRSKKFFLSHGGGKNLTYLSDMPVLQPIVLEGGEIISVGDTQLKFVPLCGPSFDWDQLQ